MSDSTPMPNDPRIWLLNTGPASAGRVYRAVAGQPNWVLRWAFGTFLIVVMIPVMLLVLTAVAVGALVFLALSGFHFVAAKLRSVLPSRDGRENVRVIQHTDRHPPN